MTQIVKQTVVNEVAPGTHITDCSCTHISVTQVNPHSVQMQFGAMDDAVSQTLGADDLRELGNLFYDIADILDGTL